jgi:hypothetical protein
MFDGRKIIKIKNILILDSYEDLQEIVSGSNLYSYQNSAEKSQYFYCTAIFLLLAYISLKLLSKLKY